MIVVKKSKIRPNLPYLIFCCDDIKYNKKKNCYKIFNKSYLNRELVLWAHKQSKDDCLLEDTRHYLYLNDLSLVKLRLSFDINIEFMDLNI